MKPIRIDFVHGQGWRKVWVCAIVVCAALAAAAAWKWQKLDRTTRDIHEQIVAIEQALERVRAPALSITDPRQASIDQAVKLLGRDLNKAFATVENLRQPGVQLRALALDGTSDTIRLEYDLNSMAKVSLVTAALNGGYENAPWKLESVIGSGASTVGSAAQTAAVFRGIWLVRVNKF